MEADWQVALAADDPVIVVPWSATAEDASLCRFVDLRQGSDRIDEIDEARRTPALRSALIALNGSGSQWWTAKCDTWNSSIEEGDEASDPYEMDADPGETAFGAGSYIDLLPRERVLLASFESCECWMRSLVAKLSSIPVRAARIDLVLRRASVDGVSGFGVTWFVAACGPTAERAEQSWCEALHLSLEAITKTRP